MLNWLSISTFSNPHYLATSSMSQTREAGWEAGQLSVRLTSTVLSLGTFHSCLSTSAVSPPLWQTGFQLVNQSWSVHNGDTEGCTALYWSKQAAATGIKVVAGYSEPRGVRTNTAILRVESSSTMMGKGSQRHAVVCGASRKKGHRRQKTSSFHQQFFLWKEWSMQLGWQE